MLKVLKSGFFTTIQDDGRFGYRDKGVPVSGAMDAISFQKVNDMLSNNIHDAALEITMTGPTLEFEKDTHISLSGAELSATLNNTPIANNEVHKIKKGDVLSYGKLEKGLRAYLGIKGGFIAENKLGSSSLYTPITRSKCLKKDTEVLYDANTKFTPKQQELSSDAVFNETVITVYKGPEFGLLDNIHFEKLFFYDFSIAKENDRMAYQLEELIAGHSDSMLTSATLPGTVQLTPSGKLIILMKDGQTTGGYPRILQLSEKSICVLAQKKFGDKITFKLV
ncbi:MAG: allophanate hydrolase [Flavobacteriaceae bacterium]|nr:MAG: allophanate hydrolase [Flavobacteriaceae bacterium]